MNDTPDKRCQNCGDVMHAPGQSERSNCGEDEVIQERLHLSRARSIDVPAISAGEVRMYEPLWN